MTRLRHGTTKIQNKNNKKKDKDDDSTYDGKVTNTTLV